MIDTKLDLAFASIYVWCLHLDGRSRILPYGMLHTEYSTAHSTTQHPSFCIFDSKSSSCTQGCSFPLCLSSFVMHFLFYLQHFINRLPPRTKSRGQKNKTHLESIAVKQQQWSVTKGRLCKAIALSAMFTHTDNRQ